MDSQAVTESLRPFQQTETWTFSSALSLLKSSPEHAASDALDEFLTHNRDVIFSPVPFSRAALKPGAKNGPISASQKEFTLREVLFSGVSTSAVASANKLASLLDICEQEALRIVLQTNQRNPEPSKGGSSASRLLFGGPAAFSGEKSTENPSDSSVDTERFSFYVKNALKERKNIVRIAAECLRVRNTDLASLVVSNMGKSLLVTDDYAIDSIKGLGSLFDLISGNYASNPLAKMVREEHVSHAVQLLQLVFEILLSSEISGKFAFLWAELMQKTSFALSVAPSVASKDVFTVLHGLVTVVTLQIFDLQSPKAKHLDDPELFKKMNELVVAHSPNNIVSYAWLILLHKRSILLEEFPNSHTSFLQVVPLESTHNTIAHLQNSLQNVSVFAEIEHLSKILGFDNVYAVVLSDLVVSAIPLIHASEDIVNSISAVLADAPNASVERFFDNAAAQELVVLARAKFPLAMGPYLKLASINGNFALHEFAELSSYMHVYDEAEFGRMCDVDSENTDLVRLTQDASVFMPFEPANKLALLLKTGTKAKVIPTSERNKVLVTFLHAYNGWALLGRVLENISSFFDATQTEKINALDAILDVLVRATGDDPEKASVVLEQMSVHTDDRDIVDVLFRVFEQSMHNRNVLLSGKFIRLFSNLMPIVSARIWPYLATSSLLPHKGKEGFSSIMFGSIETVQGEYTFTTSLVKFVFSLADNCLSTSHDYPEDAKSSIFAQFTAHILQVFEHYAHCKFNDSFHRFELGILILDVLTQTLETIFSIGPHLKTSQKPTRVFAQACEKILDVFLARPPSFRSFLPILNHIDMLADSTVSLDARDISGYLGDVWTHSACSFARLLVTVRGVANLPPSQFEKELFLRLPQLVSIYSEGGPVRKVVLDLLTALTSAKWTSETMPSILSHLGQDHSRVLLYSLAADLETSFDDYSIKISIYDFLCAIMDANQQGLSVLFISGKDVFGEPTEVSENSLEVHSTSLLSIMKRNVHEMKFYPATVTVHLLDALSLAFNSWTTARSDDSDAKFVSELVAMLEKFKKNPDSKSTPELVLASYESKVYSKIAEILSLVLFATKNDKCVQAIKTLFSSDSFAEQIPGFFVTQDYDGSLYEDVKTQFETTFPNYKLGDFAVAIKKRNRFGPGMVYDLLLLDSFFHGNAQWADLRDRIVLMSANMQYHGAQVSLSKSVGALLTAFCRRVPAFIPESYAKVVYQILSVKEPTDAYSASFARQQYFERIELAFLAAFTLNTSEKGKAALALHAMPIIEASSELMQSPDVGYLSSNKDDFHFRSLLRIIFIALSNLKSFDVISTHSQELFKLFDYVVARGTTSIIVELQNDVYLARTNKKHKPVNLNGRLDDLRLILSVLKVFVQLEVTTDLRAELSASLTRQNTVQTLLSLYSFSHLILVNNEPVFAQLSLMFVQQLLLVEDFAAKIVESKLFVVIRESVISQPLKNGGVSVSESPQLQRTWANGILPIFVSCLSRGIAVSESIFTLRVFAKQIEYCIESWSNDSSALLVSSATTLETMQLLYIFNILMSIAVSQGIQAKDPADVDMPVLPGLESQQKREDFVGFVSNLLKHPKFLKSRVYPSSVDEEALKKANGSDYDKFVTGLIEDIKELKELLV